MGYQLQFKPGKDFEWAVQPFIKSLPRLSSDPPLIVRAPPADLNKLRWQWYNFLKHQYPDQYKIQITQSEAEVTLTIFRRGGRATLQPLTQTSSTALQVSPAGPYPAEDDEDDFVSELTKIVDKIEKKGGEEGGQDQSPEDNGN